jgi:cytochrome c
MRVLGLAVAAVLVVLAGPVSAKGGPSAGERAFQKCYACHSLGGPDPNTEGPSLRHIVGRPVATEAGFGYSPAMRAYAAKQKRWTRSALDAYVANPQSVVPGNSMGFTGIKAAAERGALLDYLAKS